MTEERHEDDDRAERALRDAFEREAASFRPSALEPGRRRRQWPVVAAAVAVLMLVAGLAVAVPHGQHGTAGVAGRRDGAGVSFPTRSVSYLDVEMKAPASWRDAVYEGDACRAAAGAPYVAVLGGDYTSDLMACLPHVHPAPDGFPDGAPSTWTPSLVLAARDEGQPGPASISYEGWTLTRRVVGDVFIVLLSRDDEVADPTALVDTAHVVSGEDVNGCAPTSPVQHDGYPRPTDPRGLPPAREVTGVSVCLYDRDDTRSPGLQGSRRLLGSAAQRLVHAIAAAPAGGGPDTNTCLASDYGEQAIALTFTAGVSVVGHAYVYYSWCHGNGVDDGTTKRRITRADCAPLWGGRVVQDGGDGATFGLCHPDGS